jgi:hypothetical protein
MESRKIDCPGPPSELQEVLDALMESTSLTADLGGMLTKLCVKVTSCTRKAKNVRQRSRISEYVSVIDSLRKLVRSSPPLNAFTEALEDSIMKACIIVAEFDDPDEAETRGDHGAIELRAAAEPIVVEESPPLEISISSTDLHVEEDKQVDSQHEQHPDILGRDVAAEIADRLEIKLVVSEIESNEAGLKGSITVPEVVAEPIDTQSTEIVGSEAKLSEVIRENIEGLRSSVENAGQAMPQHEESAQLNDEPIKVFELTQSIHDWSPNYDIHKAIPIEAATKSLIECLTGKVKVVGAYGDLSSCRNFAIKLLKSSNFLLSDISNGIVGLYSSLQSLLVLLIVDLDLMDFTDRPFNKNCLTVELLAYLLDLSQLVAVLPSPLDLDQWYFSTVPSSENPYKPRTYKNSMFNMKRSVINSKQLEEVQVRNHTRETLLLSRDSCWSAFSYRKIDHNYEEELQKAYEIMQELSDMLRSRYHAVERANLRSKLNLWWWIVPKKSCSIKLPTIRKDLEREFNDLIEEIDSEEKKLRRDCAKSFFTRIHESYDIRPLGMIAKVFKYPFEHYEYLFLRRVQEFSYTLSESDPKQFTKFLKRRNSSDKVRREHFLENVASDIDLQIAQGKAEIKENSERRLNEMLQRYMDMIMPAIQEVENIMNKIEFVLEADQTSVKLIAKNAERNFKIVRPTNIEERFEVMSLSSELVFVMFRVHGAMDYYQVSTKERGFREELRFSSIEGISELVPGSTPNRYVVINHTSRKAHAGSLHKQFGIERGSELELYQHDTCDIVSAYVMSSQEKLIYINEHGHVLYVNTIGKDRLVTLVRCEQDEESKEPDDLQRIRVLFRPKQKEAIFLEVRAPENEAAYIFRTNFGLEVYDLTFGHLHSLALEPGTGYKVMNDLYNYIYILLCQDTTLKCYRFASSSETIKTTSSTQAYEAVPGNPVVDALHCAYEKFGGKRSVRAKLAVIFEAEQDKEHKVKGYIESLDSLRSETELCHVGKLAAFLRKVSVDEDIKGIDAAEVSWMLSTRAPLHIASIQKGNLVPLKNGVNNFDQLCGNLHMSTEDFFVECHKEIRLGIYETLLESAQGLRVIGIIGRQSSGKSYLMNQIFGTRFNVSALRCTDGIWMSMAKIDGQSFVVLDCEGLLSTDRSEQEEIKMCLALAAVCDLMIFNTDISGINRNIVDLFDKFSSSLGRLPKEGLFRGTLCITTRDVHCQADAETQLNKSLKELEDAGKLNFVFEFFAGNYIFSHLHIFTEKEFKAEVEENFRQFYTTLPVNWSGKEFLDKLKIILIMIFTDDNEPIDERMFPVLANEVQSIIKTIDLDSTLAKKCLAPLKLSLEVRIADVLRVVQFEQYLQFTAEDTKKPFDDLLAMYFEDEGMQRACHNEWNSAVNSLMVAYFQTRADRCIAYLEGKLSRQKKFTARVEAETRQAKYTLDKVTMQIKLCLLLCQNCQLSCTLKDRHQGDHDCRTNHLCCKACAPCGDERARCCLKAGHFSTHICEAKKHICGKPCPVAQCDDICYNLLGHSDEVCNCTKKVHYCGQPCKMYSFCNRTCQQDINQPHSFHDCGHNACSSKCIMCSRPCASRDHFHDIAQDIESVNDPREPNLITKKHLCDTAHSCYEKCRHPGRCKTTFTTEIRTYQNKFNTLSYNFIVQVQVKLDCKIIIPQGELSHEDIHYCSVDVHKCTATCPDCKVVCDKPYDHTDFHSSLTHRNKENCIYLAQSADFEHNADGSVRRFAAGSQAVIEFCDSACNRAGRGHSHPVQCKGNENCLEVTLKGKAEHSEEEFNPPGTYDLVRCDAYWNLHSWVPPLQSKNPNAYFELLKCNFYCSHSSHPEGEKFYCEAPAMHSKSSKNSDHNLPDDCLHPLCSTYEIVFVIDATGSMALCIEEVKNAITAIITKVYPAQIKCRFGIVAFTDHYGSKGCMTDPLRPTCMYPTNGVLESSTHEQAIQFINRLKLSGGGGNGGEAVMDGLSQAALFEFNPASRRILFLLTDEKPHGDEFGRGSEYPRGCPCLSLENTTWQSILTKLKSKEFDFYIIKLNEQINMTSALFAKFYGQSLSTINLAQAASSRSFELMSKTIESTVKKTVQKFMELSN